MLSNFPALDGLQSVLFWVLWRSTPVVSSHQNASCQFVYIWFQNGIYPNLWPLYPKIGYSMPFNHVFSIIVIMNMIRSTGFWGTHGNAGCAYGLPTSCTATCASGRTAKPQRWGYQWIHIII